MLIILYSMKFEIRMINCYIKYIIYRYIKNSIPILMLKKQLIKILIFYIKK